MTHLLHQWCGALSWPLHADCHLSDTVFIDVTQLQKENRPHETQDSYSLLTQRHKYIYIQSSPTLLNLEFKKLFNGLIAVNEILIILRAYRPPAVPLHRAVVVFHHPGMIQQLSNSKTSLGVHLQDTKGIYTSVDNRRHISLYTRHQLAAPEHPRVHGVTCLHVRVREMSLKLLN